MPKGVDSSTTATTASLTVSAKLISGISKTGNLRLSTPICLFASFRGGRVGGVLDLEDTAVGQNVEVEPDPDDAILPF